MPDEGPDRVQARAAALLPEEVEAGSDDPMAQAGAILAESDAREDDRVDPPGQPVERRRSEDTVELPVVDDGPRAARARRGRSARRGQDVPKP